jgi:hypothetical protein
MTLVEAEGWIVLQHEQSDRLRRSVPLLQQSPYYIRANTTALMGRGNIQLLWKDFISYRSELDPADIIVIKHNDPSIVRTPEARKLSLFGRHRST